MAWRNIFKAVENGDLGKVKEFLDRGIDINIRNLKDETLLMQACKNNNYVMVKYLIDRGADVNAFTRVSMTALLYAAKYSDLDTTELLLDNGANINTKNTSDQNALSVSLKSKKLHIAKLLINRGIDINNKTNIGSTPLILAARYNKSPEILELLLEKGVDINAITHDGNSALIRAVTESNHDSSIENVKILLDSGANVNIVNNKGKTALSYAVELSNKTSNLETVRLLLEYGADPFIETECPTQDCVKLLAEYRWKRLYQRDKDTARRYFLQTNIPKEIWEIILLHKRKDQLCKNLNSEKNKEILILFALEFGIPITKDMTKGKICRLLSRYLVYGKEEKNAEKVEKEDDIMKAKIKDIAFKAGLDPSEDISSLLHKLSKMF